MVVAFYVIMGFLLALFAAALVLWILYAVKTGLQTDNTSERSRVGTGTYEESVVPAEGGAKKQEPSREKKPQGP